MTVYSHTIQAGYSVTKSKINNEGSEWWTRYISHFRWAMWLAAVRTWLAQGAKHLIFLKTENIEVFFMNFMLEILYERSFIMICSHFWSKLRLR